MRWAMGVVAVAGGIVAGVAIGPRPVEVRPAAARAKPARAAGTPAVSFLPDGAEAGPGASYVARAPGLAASIAPACAVISRAEPYWTPDRVRSVLADATQFLDAQSAPRRVRNLRLEMIGADAAASAEAAQPLAFTTNVCLGDDPSRWRTGVRSFGSVACRGVWPGIDVEWHARKGRLEFDFVVAPGADPHAVAVRVGDPDGADAPVRLDADGSLVANGGDSSLRLGAPVVYQERDGVREPVEARYVCDPPDARGRVRVTFAVGRYDASRPLVIDPDFTPQTQSSFPVGGSGDDQVAGVVADPMDPDAFYVLGQSTSPWFQGSTPLGQRDIVLYRMKDGALTSQLVAGGSGLDTARALAAGPDGLLYVGANTGSSNATATNGTYRGTGAGLFKLLLFRTDRNLLVDAAAPISWGSTDSVAGLAFDDAGHVVIAGDTSSALPATPGTIGATKPVGAGSLSYLAAFDANFTQLLRSTYACPKAGQTIGVANVDGNFAVAMNATEGGAPTTAGGAFAGGSDLYAELVSPDFTSRLFGMYSGGTGYEFGSKVKAGPGPMQFFIPGVSNGGTGWNTPITAGMNFLGGNDETLWLFDASMMPAAPGTLVSVHGGTGNEIGMDADYDADGWHGVGFTNSGDFPAMNGIDLPKGSGASNATLVILDPSTFLPKSSGAFGGDGANIPSAIWAQGSRHWIALTTNAANFPLVNAPAGTQPVVGDGICHVSYVTAPPCPPLHRPVIDDAKTKLTPVPRSTRVGLKIEWDLEPGLDPFPTLYIVRSSVTDQGDVTNETIDVTYNIWTTHQGSRYSAYIEFEPLTAGVERHRFTVSVSTSCTGATSNTIERTIGQTLRPGKATVSSDDAGTATVNVGIKSKTPPVFANEAQLVLEFLKDDPEAQKVAAKFAEKGFLPQSGSGKKARVVNNLTIPAGQSSSALSFDLSGLTRTVKATIRVAINGFEKATKVKFKPPKKKK